MPDASDPWPIVVGSAAGVNGTRGAPG